jgi:ubiquinone/menaquinone biosynthesis C-methylase UbiE
MAIQKETHQEHPSTYVVQDRANETELIRLNLQDQMLTTSMGGVLPEQPDPAAFRRILDVACGTGAWLIEAARTCPQMSLLIGADISKHMIEFASSQAEYQKVSDRVEFHTMDALRMLEFPNGYFDLVNQRLGMSYLRTWDWPKLLQEFIRVTRWGGIVRLTESDVLIDSSSPALMRSNEIFLHSLIRTGHLFSPDRLGIINALPSLLSRHGFTHLQTYPYLLEYRAGTPAWQPFFEDMKRIMQTFAPFARKLGNIPEDAEDLAQQAIEQMQDPNFVAIWRMQTVWGTRP